MAKKIKRKTVASKTAKRKTSLPPKAVKTVKTVKAVKRTSTRNSPIPKSAPAKAAAKPKIITGDMIAVRAFEIHCSGTGGSEFDNWLRAERELSQGI